MAVTSFASATSGLTDQGGERVLSEYKGGNCVITLAKLPAGSYYLTVEGTGDIAVNAYTGTTVGNTLISSTALNGAKTLSLTVPSGVTGIYVSGSYSGSMVFQKITQSTNATVASTTFTVDPEVGDWGAWNPIQNTTKMILINGQTASVYDTVTKTTVTGTFGYRDNGNNTWSTASNILAAGNGNTIVVSGGYDAWEVRYHKVSTDGGATWTTALGTQSSYYWDILNYENGKFILAASATGGGSGTTNYYTSTDGVNWTGLSFPTNAYWSDVRYVGSVYVAMPGTSRSSSGAYSTTNTYYTSPDAVSWTARTLSTSSRKGAGCPVYQGTMFIYDTNGLIRSTTDGLNWSTYYDFGTNSYLANINYMNGLSDAGVVKSTANGHQGAYFTGYYWNDSGAITIIRCRPGEAMYQFDAYQSPFVNSGAGRGKHPVEIANKLALRSYDYKNYYSPPAIYYSPFGSVSRYIDSDNAQNNSGLYYSSRFKRWYYATQSAYYISEVDSDTEFTRYTGVDGNVPTNFVEWGSYIGFHNGSIFWRSSDGVTFTGFANQGNPSPAGWGSSLVYFNNLLIARFGNTGQMSTDNGASWFTYQPIGGSSPSLQYLTVNSTFVCAHGSNSSGNVTYYSTNGYIWTLSSTGSWSGNQSTNYNPINGVNFFKNNGTTSGSIQFDNTFAPTSMTYPHNGLITVFKMGSLFCMLPDGNRNTTYNWYATSGNGITWTFRYTLNQKYWFRGGGSDSQALFLAVDPSYNETLQRARIVTSLTIG